MNKTEIIRRYPSAKPRIVRLSDFLEDQTGEIFDPYGESRERFDECYTMIMHSVSHVMFNHWEGSSETPKTTTVVKNRDGDRLGV